MRKILFFAAIAVLLGACREAEIPRYEKREHAINFWAPPVPGVIATYPDALTVRYTFDTGSFAGFIDRGLSAFSTVLSPITVGIGVEVMGFAPAEDMTVKIKVDERSSDDVLGVTMADDYLMASGEGTALLPVEVDVNSLTSGQTARVVLKFDYDNMEFRRGLIQRDSVTIVCSNIPNGTMRIPTATNGFGLSEMNLMFWEWGMDLATTYGAVGVNKMLFMCVVLNTTSLGSLNPFNTDQCAANSALLKEALAEYKTLNAADPVKYPPIYEGENSETWISFP